MADLVLAYDIINDTAADAVPVQSNYTRIESHVNTNVIRTDGATVMQAPLQLFGDPIGANDAVRKGFLDLLMPVGVILPYGGSAVPGGLWALANGADMSTTVYPDLFGAIGFNFGGAGSTFKLPDLRGRTMMGQDGSAPFTTLGAKAGNKDSTGLPSHNHGTVTHNHGATSGLQSAYHGHGVNLYTGDQIGAHAHGPGAGTAFVVEAPGSAGFALNPGSQAIFSTGGTAGENANHHHPINGTTDNENANHNHVVTVGYESPATNDAVIAPTNANLPPYIVINFIVRVS